MAGFEKARTRQVRIRDLRSFVAHEIIRKFERHGTIVAMYIEKENKSRIEFAYREQAQAACHAENGSIINGVFGITLEGANGKKSMGEESSGVNSFLRYEERIPKIVEHSSNEHNFEQTSEESSLYWNNLPEGNTTMSPINIKRETNENFSQVEIKPDIEQLYDASVGNVQNGASVKDLSKMQLRRLSPECNKIYLRNLQDIISCFLKERFAQYGKVDNVWIQKFYAIIYYEFTEQAHAAYEAEKCGKLLGTQLQIGFGCEYAPQYGPKKLRFCCSKHTTVTPKTEINQVSSACSTGQKRKREKSQQETFTLSSNKCQIIVMSNTDTVKSKYDPIKAVLEEYGLTAEVLFINEDIPISTVRNVDCISLRIKQIDDKHQILNVKVVQGKFKNKQMRLEDLPTFIIRTFIHKLQTQKNFQLKIEIKSTKNQISDNFPNENAENLKKKKVLLEKVSAILNNQLALSLKKCSELEINTQNVKTEILEVKKE